MPLSLDNLDRRTRQLMIEELELDIKRGALYISPRLNDYGKGRYRDLLRNAMLGGTDTEFAIELSSGCLNDKEPVRRGGTQSYRKVPSNAHETLAEGEFNRYYVRALCRRALEEGYELEVCRAKAVRNPRPESENKIGETVDARKLLEDLRENIGIDTALGIPDGPNSGLTVRIRKRVSGALA